MYAPGCEPWLEVSSVSWFSDYQARRADIRYRPAGEKGTASSTPSTGRPSPCPGSGRRIIENDRQPDGSVALPEVLWPYLRGHRSIPARG